MKTRQLHLLAGVALFGLMAVVDRAHADVTTALPLFTWSDPPVGALGFEVICDGHQVGPRIDALSLTYQTKETDFVPAAQPATHSCRVDAVQPSGVARPKTNYVTFIVPAAAVVVPPPRPFALTVRPGN